MQPTSSKSILAIFMIASFNLASSARVPQINIINQNGPAPGTSSYESLVKNVVDAIIGSGKIQAPKATVNVAIAPQNNNPSNGCNNCCESDNSAPEPNLLLKHSEEKETIIKEYEQKEPIITSDKHSASTPETIHNYLSNELPTANSNKLETIPKPIFDNADLTKHEIKKSFDYDSVANKITDSKPNDSKPDIVSDKIEGKSSSPTADKVNDSVAVSSFKEDPSPSAANVTDSVAVAPSKNDPSPSAANMTDSVAVAPSKNDPSPSAAYVTDSVAVAPSKNAPSPASYQKNDKKAPAGPAAADLTDSVVVASSKNAPSPAAPQKAVTESSDIKSTPENSSPEVNRDKSTDIAATPGKDSDISNTNVPVLPTDRVAVKDKPANTPVEGGKPDSSSTEPDLVTDHVAVPKASTILDSGAGPTSSDISNAPEIANESIPEVNTKLDSSSTSGHDSSQVKIDSIPVLSENPSEKKTTDQVSEVISDSVAVKSKQPDTPKESDKEKLKSSGLESANNNTTTPGTSTGAVDISTTPEAITSPSVDSTIPETAAATTSPSADSTTPEVPSATTGSSTDNTTPEAGTGSISTKSVDNTTPETTAAITSPSTSSTTPEATAATTGPSADSSTPLESTTEVTTIPAADSKTPETAATITSPSVDSKSSEATAAATTGPSADSKSPEATSATTKPPTEIAAPAPEIGTISATNPTIESSMNPSVSSNESNNSESIKSNPKRISEKKVESKSGDAETLKKEMPVNNASSSSDKTPEKASTSPIVDSNNETSTADSKNNNESSTNVPTEDKKNIDLAQVSESKTDSLKNTAEAISSNPSTTDKPRALVPSTAESKDKKETISTQTKDTAIENQANAPSAEKTAIAADSANIAPLISESAKLETKPEASKPVVDIPIDHVQDDSNAKTIGIEGISSALPETDAKEKVESNQISNNEAVNLTKKTLEASSTPETATDNILKSAVEPVIDAKALNSIPENISSTQAQTSEESAKNPLPPADDNISTSQKPKPTRSQTKNRKRRGNKKSVESGTLNKSEEPLSETLGSTEGNVNELKKDESIENGNLTPEQAAAQMSTEPALKPTISVEEIINEKK